MIRKTATICRKAMLVNVFVLFAGYVSFSQIQQLPDSLPVRQPHFFIANRVTLRSFILPASLITTGALGISGEFVISNPEIKEERDETFARFHTSVDNYLQFAPIAAGYLMLIHNPQHNAWTYTEKVAVMEIIVNGLVQSTKHITKVQRPDGTPYSFPSGHTAEAFAGATLFCDEFAQHNTWLTTTAYAGATAVGVLRVLNNKHWTSDIIAGAGFGILSAKVSEWIIEPHGKKRTSAHTYQL